MKVHQRQRPQENKPRREAILDASLDLFYTNGYSATSVQEIADSVGILKGSLYHYIHGKEDILYEVLLRIHDGFPKPPSVDSGEVLASIRSFVFNYVRHVAGNVEAAAVFHREVGWLTPARRSSIIGKRDANDDFLRNAIARGIREGVIPSGTDPKLASMAIFGMANGLNVWFQESGPISVDTVAATYGEFAIRLVRGESE